MKTFEKDHPSSTGHGEPAPKLFAWLASTSTVILMIAVQILPRGGHQLLRITGATMLLLTAFFIFTPFYLLAKYGGSGAGEAYLQSNQVVDQGLYAIVRHPQYLGYMLLAGGFFLLAQHWIAALFAVFSMTCFYFQAVQEERYCLARFGEPYGCYLQRVPRFNLIQGVHRTVRGKKND